MLPLCKCGCGGSVTINQNSGLPNRFIHGHQQGTPKKKYEGVLPLCKCGCKMEVTINQHDKVPNKYIKGHGNRGRKWSPEIIKKMSNVKKGKNCGVDNPNYGKPMSQEQKKKISDSLKLKYKNKRHPNHGKTHTVEQNKKHSEWMMGRFTGENHPQYGKMSGKNNHNYGNTGEKHRMYGKHLSEDHKKKISESGKGKQAGPKNHNWQGVVSFEPYCLKFNQEFKERVRDFFDRKCFLCGEIENGRKLSIHHVNYDKMTCCNDVKPLFVPLCDKCHSTTNFNRLYWEERLTKELMEKYNGECYLPKMEKEA